MITQMFPGMGTKLRDCAICGCPQRAHDDRLTVHEMKCHGLLPLADEDLTCPYRLRMQESEA